MLTAVEVPKKVHKGEIIMERKQFTFYRSFYETIQGMRTYKERAIAYQTICDYALNGTEPDLQNLTPQIVTAFRSVKPVLDTAARRAARMLSRMADAEVKLAMGRERLDDI